MGLGRLTEHKKQILSTYPPGRTWSTAPIAAVKYVTDKPIGGSRRRSNLLHSLPSNFIVGDRAPDAVYIGGHPCSPRKICLESGIGNLKYELFHASRCEAYPQTCRAVSTTTASLRF